jgi:hypothetical protein
MDRRLSGSLLVVGQWQLSPGAQAPVAPWASALGGGHFSRPFGRSNEGTTLQARPTRVRRRCGPDGRAGQDVKSVIRQG